MASSINYDANFTKPNIFKCEGDFFKMFHLEPDIRLGSGSYGSVIRARTSEKNSTFKAVKLINITQRRSKAHQLGRFVMEVRIMNGLNHPNVMCDVMAAWCPGYFAISMKYCPNGTLETCISHQPIDSIFLGRYTVQFTCAVRYLHKNRVFHADIKLANILLDSNSDLIVTDFGFSKILPDGDQMLCKVPGTVPYIAPEASNQGVIDAFKVESFAVGVVIWCMVTGRNARGHDHEHFMPLLTNPNCECDSKARESSSRQNNNSAEYRTLVSNLLEPDPHHRWTVPQACDHLKTFLPDSWKQKIDSL